MKTNYLFNYLIQLIYVISMFYNVFALCCLLIYKFFKEFLKIKKCENNAFLIIFFRIKDIFNTLISITFFYNDISICISLDYFFSYYYSIS